MLLTDQGKLAPAANLGELLPVEWLPPDKRPLSVAQLLAHRAGLPAWRPFYREILQAPPQARAGLLPRLAAAAPLEHAPDTVTLYSDLGFMLLQAVVEAVSGLPLDRFCEERIYQPLGLKILGFNPLPILAQAVRTTENRKQETENRLYAATESGLIAGRNLYGEVHDENAWAAGGVAGHAGLFGTGPEVFALLAALYRAYQGDTGLPFSPATVRLFFTPVAPGARALGFDTPGPEACPVLGRALLFTRQRRPSGLHRHLFLAGPQAGADGSLTHQPGAPGPGRQGEDPGLPAPVPRGGLPGPGV